MSNDLYDVKHLKYGILIYAVIFGLIMVDIVSDYQEGIEISHIAIELIVLFSATIGLSLLAKAYYQHKQHQISVLKTDLSTAQAEAKRWQAESRDLVQGLAKQIYKQFESWQLTEAESEVGLLLLKGFSHQEIANIRQVSERTAREQARALYRKAGLTNRAELSAFFLEDLLLPVSGDLVE